MFLKDIVMDTTPISIAIHSAYTPEESSELRQESTEQRCRFRVLIVEHMIDLRGVERDPVLNTVSGEDIDDLVLQERNFESLAEEKEKD